MEAKRERTEPTTAPPSAASAALVSVVLGNDDLLREILLRLIFPTTLVHAALIAKRWLRHASDPAFLCLFRARHPPALLGFYASQLDFSRPHIVPISQAPELATAIHRASFPGGHYLLVKDCRNGRGLVLSSIDRVFHQLEVLDLLQPTGGVVLIPPPPPDCDCEADGIFLPDPGDGGEGGEGVVAAQQITTDTVTAVYAEVTPPARGKIYMATDTGFVPVLDLAALGLSVLQLPNRPISLNLLYREYDSKLFLIHAEGFMLSIWHHKEDGNGAHNWVLVHDKIIVHEACIRHEHALLKGADDNLEFVFLWLEASEVLVHILLKSRIEKVYDELTMRDKRYIGIKPFMMHVREENKLEE
ncbi:hypothetical protein SETIT_1G134000v2 [Setaria italica]|uniref:F-box protein AT5G49610-like beta-propeller domain-containing protein n=1 Tax=Setaria italica TaxID=4555 RepID=A0A368PKX0_SETIT|nr:hypothetical protein SETIT_1G134000v2 [Setaria italica]